MRRDDREETQASEVGLKAAQSEFLRLSRRLDVPGMALKSGCAFARRCDEF